MNSVAKNIEQKQNTNDETKTIVTNSSMLHKLPKTEHNNSLNNTSKSLRGIKSLSKLQNISSKIDLTEDMKSKPNMKIEETIEDIITLTNNKKSLRGIKLSSKLSSISCNTDFKENEKPKLSFVQLQKTRKAKHNFETSVDELSLLSKLSVIPCKNDLVQRSESNPDVRTSVKGKIEEDICNFEIENLVNCNEEPKTKYNLDCYIQSGPRNWQSQWKEFEADIKKEVSLVERLLKTNDPDSLVNCGILVLKKLNTFSASLKQKFPYRARIYYCLGKSYLASGNYQEAFKCSIELLRIGDILKDNKIIYNGYSVACKTYTKQREYRKAAEFLQKMITFEENLCERAKLYHRIGEWYFELSEWDLAKSFGDLCLQAAVKASNNKSCMMASALIGKSEIKLQHGKKALNALFNARHFKKLCSSEKGPTCIQNYKPTASVNKKFTKKL